MASDILLYSAKFIPVGEDQRQHIELARDLAIRFNKKFGVEVFTAPETWDKQIEFAHSGNSVRIMSLKNPEVKMSKSIDDPSGTILLNEDPESARAKIMEATTDSLGTVKHDKENQPGITNLLDIYCALVGIEISEAEKRFSNYVDLKKATADAVAGLLKTIQNNKAKVDLSHVEAKLVEDEKKMSELANAKLTEVQSVIGLRD